MVLAGAAVTCGGVSLFVAYFVSTPIATTLFRAADLLRRLMPAAILVGSSTFTMSAIPGTPVIPNKVPAASPVAGSAPHAGIEVSGGSEATNTAEVRLPRTLRPP
jgi:H+/gluconate symporter-like permease